MHDQQQALLLIEKSLQGFLLPSRLPDSPFAISLICMILSLLSLLSSKSQRVGWCCLLLRFSFSYSSRILSSLLSICFFFSNSCRVLSFLTRCPQNSRWPSNQAKLNTRLQTSHSSFSSSSLSQSGSFKLASFHWEEASPSQPEWSGVGFMIRYDEFLVYFLTYSADDQSSSICLFWFCWPNCEDLRRVSSIYWLFSSSLSSTSWICLCSFKIYSYFFSTFLLRSKHTSSRLPTHRFLSSSLALSSLPILLRLPICRSFSLIILFSFLTSSWYLLRESLSWYLFQQEKSLTSSPITSGLGLLSLAYDFSVGRDSPLLVMALERVSLILVRFAMRCFSQIIQMLATSFLLSRLLRSFSHCDCFLLISLRTLSNSSCRPSIFSVLALGSLARGLAGWFMINCQLQIKWTDSGSGGQVISQSAIVQRLLSLPVTQEIRVQFSVAEVFLLQPTHDQWQKLLTISATLGSFRLSWQKNDSPFTPTLRFACRDSNSIFALTVVLLPTPTSMPGKKLACLDLSTRSQFCCRVSTQAVSEQRQIWGRMAFTQSFLTHSGQSCRYSYLDQGNTEGAMWICSWGYWDRTRKDRVFIKLFNMLHLHCTHPSSLISRGGDFPPWSSLQAYTVAGSQPARLGMAGSLSSPWIPSISWLAPRESMMSSMNCWTWGRNPFIHWKLFLVAMAPL